MKIEEISNLTLTDMKRVAKELNIAGYQRVSTKDGMMERINEKIAELGLSDIPDLEAEEPIKIEAKPVERMRIKDHPHITCIIETRDEDEVDLAIGINEYQCFIQFGKEITIPVPVYNMVKEQKTIKFKKDENGFAKTEEINKYIVSKV
jgi:hypothetical protein